MKVVAQIKEPIAYEMELFEEKFALSMRSKVALLNRITHYIVNRKGKQMRPMFVFLTAKMLGDGQVNDRTYRGASVIELIHTASLVHDDVVDESNQRRGFFSLNALWKNKIAVLVGDFLFSKGDIYYEIIRQKTATLIAACSALGAAAVHASQEDIKRMHKFGELVGQAFQIKDDLFDYGDAQIGKPTGIDIKEQKMTLPLIHVLNTVSKKDRNWIINSIKNHNTNKKRVKEVIKFVKDNGGLEYAISKMKELQQEALNLLDTYPESEYKASLELMVNYVIERKK